MISSSGQVVWQGRMEAFGSVSVSINQIDNPLRFPGQYHDVETGLYYNFHRYYAPKLGRYITSDPIGLAGGVNTYGYVGGMPTGFVDPYGLRTAAGGRYGNVPASTYGMPWYTYRDLNLGSVMKASAGATAALANAAIITQAMQNADEREEDGVVHCPPYTGPGNDDECRQLRELKNKVCGSIPVLKKGNQILTNFKNLKKVGHLQIGEILERKNAINECLRVRQMVTDRCFNGVTDQVHAEQEYQLRNALSKMDELIELLERNGLGK